MKLSTDELERIAVVFRAFSEATRLAILQELMDGELNVGAIVGRLTTTQANVSKQLKLLYDAGLISRRKQGNQVLYRICDPLVKELCSLVCDKINRDSATSLSLRYG